MKLTLSLSDKIYAVNATENDNQRDCEGPRNGENDRD